MPIVILSNSLNHTKKPTHIYCVLSKAYLRDFLNLHETHATVSSDRKSLMVAEARNLDSYLFTCLEQNEVD